MSLPKTHSAAPPLSSSSSKQSLRGINTNIPPPRPHPYEHRRSLESPAAPFSPQSAQNVHTDVFSSINPEDEGDGDFGDPPQPEEPSNTFKPFFTLIEDANSSEYHHPTVHYIFSDDDPDLVTEAALRALQISDDSSGTKARTRQQHPSETGDGEDTVHDGRLHKDTVLPPPAPGVKERYIILDVEPSDWRQPQGPQGPSSAPSDAQTVIGGAGSLANSPVQHNQPFQHHRAASRSSLPRPPTTSGTSPYTITAAHSLNPDWQVLSTSLSPAPSFHSFDNNNNHQPSSASTLTAAVKSQAPGPPSDSTTVTTTNATIAESQQAQSSSANKNPKPENETTLLLRIEGTPGFPHVSPCPREYRDRDRDRDTSEATNPNKQSLEEMMDQFAKRMEELRRVIEAGGMPTGQSAIEDPQQTAETGAGAATTPTIIRTKATNDGLDDMVPDKDGQGEDVNE